MIRITLALLMLCLSGAAFSASNLLYNKTLPYGENTLTGNLVLPIGKLPINTKVVSKIKACVANPYADRPENIPDFPSCVAEFSQYGFAVLFTRHAGHRIPGYFTTENLNSIVFNYDTLLIKYNEATNSIDYKIHYTITDTTCADSGYDVGHHCGVINMGIVSNDMAKGDIYTNFNGPQRKIEVTLGGAYWVDIHYSVNGGAKQNYRMVKNGIEYAHNTLNTIKNTDKVTFNLTYQLVGGAAYDSKQYFFEASGIPGEFTASYVNGLFTFNPVVVSDWVDVHYSINNGALLNHRMTKLANNTFVWKISEVTVLPGQSVTYSFTYFANGYARDTAKTTVIQQ